MALKKFHEEIRVFSGHRPPAKKEVIETLDEKSCDLRAKINRSKSAVIEEKEDLRNRIDELSERKYLPPSPEFQPEFDVEPEVSDNQGSAASDLMRRMQDVKDTYENPTYQSSVYFGAKMNKTSERPPTPIVEQDYL